MLKQIYLLLKEQLQSKVSRLEYVDYYLNQYAQIGEDAVWTSPACYIRFLPMNWRSLGGATKIQRTDLSIEIHLVSDTAYGDERDITDEVYIDHLGIEAEIHRVLQGLSLDLMSFENVVDSCLVLQNMERIQTLPHGEINNLMVSVVTYKGVATDYSNVEHLQELLTEITIDTQIDITLSQAI